ncbi:MAG: stage V sporulation protein AD [Clostridia bacterium]|nr:stage V sporulation protein AD [Clostridia bacterium]
MQKKPFLPSRRVFITSAGSVVGHKEKTGPIGSLFDLGGDDRFGKDSWEKAEAEMQRLALGIAMRKGELVEGDLDLLVAGDLVNQCVSSSYGLLGYRIPFLGLFGACSTCAEGLLLATLATASVCRRCAAVTSSHFCTAERQFRYPLEYGGQRTPTAQWTVTGSGAFIVSSLTCDAQRTTGEYVPEILDVMPGCIVDRGITDAANMGAAMAPAAADLILRYRDSGCLGDGTLFVTGDLGAEGSAILYDLLRAQGLDIEKRHTDCGLRIYQREAADAHAGASGCGCSAVVLAAELLEMVKTGEIADLCFLATGALMNTAAIQQGQSIPGIAHLVHIRGTRRDTICEARTE